MKSFVDFVIESAKVLPLPRHIFLRILVILFYASFVFNFFPFIAGGLIAHYIYKNVTENTVKFIFIGITLFFSVLTGSTWVLRDQSTSKAQIVSNEQELPTSTSENKVTPTETPTPTIEPTIIKAPTATPVPPTATLTPFPTRIPTIESTSVPSYGSSKLSNDNTYINSHGVEIHSPTYYDSVPAGATAICRDGTYSFSQSRRGTCSHHGGVAQWL